MSKRVFKTELDAVNNSLQVQVNNSISKNIVDAKGDIVTASAADTPIRLAVGTNEQRLVVDSATTSGLKYVADTTNYAVGAKGDLLAGTAADTVSALTVGANGETLVADSSASTGLRWSGATTQNPVINSAFDIWQRGTSIAGSAGSYLYTADRWQMNNVSTFTVSRQATGDTTNLPFIQYCGRVARNSGSTSTSLNIIYNSFETTNSIPFAGKTVTLSFYARAGANFSSSSNILNAILRSGTGTDQSAMTGYTGASDIISGTPTLTTTWQRFTYTGTVGATANELAIGFYYTPTGTAGAADYFEVTGVQLDIGSVALPYRRNSATLAGELQAAQRYFIDFTGNTGAYGTLGFLGSAFSTTQAFLVYQLPVVMRTAASITTSGTISLSDGVSSWTTTGFANAQNATTAGGASMGMIVASVASGLTQYRPVFANPANTARIQFSSEL